MDKDEEILGLITAAKKQQEAAEQAIGQLDRSRNELHAALANQQNDLANEHREVIKQHQKNFNDQHATLKNALHWLPLVGSVAVTFLLCLSIVGVMYLYLSILMEDLAEAEANWAKLNSINPITRTCRTRDGSRKPCIAVIDDGKKYVIDGKTFKLIDSK